MWRLNRSGHWVWFIAITVLLGRCSNSFLSQHPSLFRSSSLLPSFTTRTVRQQQTSELFSTETDEMLQEIQAMRVPALKAELKALRIPTKDVFEKSELVNRLYDAWKEGRTVKTYPPTSADVLQGKLFFASLEGGKGIKAFNADNIFIEDMGISFPCIQIRVEPTYVLPGKKKRKHALTLLLDTAATGLVLRPDVATDRLGLPVVNQPGSMTGAGGKVSLGGVAELKEWYFDGQKFGPGPAALLEIGGLPSKLDGIIGLNWLMKFACVELNFQTGRIFLYRIELSPPLPDGYEIVSDTKLQRTNLGLWKVPVLLDGRGPINLLVDTGAAGGFLNWKGLEQLGLTKEQVEPLSNFGAIGSDNKALQLTHRFAAKRSFEMTGEGGGSVPLTSDINFDVGDLPVLDQLSADKVGGIMGVNAFAQCGLCRFRFNGANPRMTILRQAQE